MRRRPEHAEGDRHGHAAADHRHGGGHQSPKTRSTNRTGPAAASMSRPCAVAGRDALHVVVHRGIAAHVGLELCLVHGGADGGDLLLHRVHGHLEHEHRQRRLAVPGDEQGVARVGIRLYAHQTRHRPWVEAGQRFGFELPEGGAARRQRVAREHDDKLRQTRVEPLLHEAQRLLSGRLGVREAAALELASDVGAGHQGDDERHRPHGQHPPAEPVREPADGGKHACKPPQSAGDRHLSARRCSAGRGRASRAATS